MGLLTYIQSFFSRKEELKSVMFLEGVDLADAIFNNLVAEQKVPGLSVTILKEGETLLQKGYGYSNLEKELPLEPENTSFRIASISKCITGLAFGKMVEEGILNWDDSFYKHVPYYPKKKQDFTLRQLASHTAGIRAYRGKEFALNKPYSIKDSLQVFQDDPLVFQPGKGYLYNSFDFVLLSLAMQEASGIPFEAYVSEKILLPLGMNKTATPFCHAEPVEASLNQGENRLRQHFDKLSVTKSDAKFYSKRGSEFKKAIEVNNFYKLAGGGYQSTSHDIAKMGQAILEQKLLKSETYDQLFTSQMITGKPTYYGLGFQVSQDNSGRSFVGHVGSSVGAYTNFFVYPDKEIVISILINCTDPKVQELLDKAVNCFFTDSPLI